MPNLFRYILPLLILLTSLKGEAQVYPVQSTLQITPPYSLTLADYVAPGSEKVALNIFLADVNRPELSVRLRLRIEGVGIRIETKAEYLPEPMMISGGVPLRLIGADLADYFDPRNLNFSGITQREYEQKAALPEGLYEFTFEVIEYNRGVKISNSATVMAWLILNDPPLINLPKDNDKIRIQSPQQVIFQWTPRHTGSPNAAFSTEYEFRLVEVWPSTRNPNDAILTSPAIFETTTAASTLIYGPAETPLEPGRRYAFRIKAKSIVGVDELNLFKNNGYSQVSTFVYGDACTLPTGIQAEVISSSKIGFAWDTQDNHTGYNIKYRLANTPNAAWYTNTSALNDIEINSLQPATTYEYQVAAACGSYESEYSPVATVTTNEAQAITYSCGLPLNPFDLDPSQLIESLKTGDVIQAGDFDVKLTEVSGSNGIFTGKGVIEVPFFNKARLQASFSSISVNKELRMVAGSMNITGGGVEVIPAGVMDLMDELTEALALADSALNLVESNLPQPFDPYSFVADKEVKIPGTITSVTKGANGGVVVTASNGTEQTIPAGGTTAITDSNGNGYLIDSKGNIHPTTAAIASAAARREYNLNVNFAKASDTRFGFDAKKHDALLTTYEHVKDTYYASWKSIATGQTDNALALLEGTNVDKTKIHFEQSGVGLGTSDLGNISQSPSPNSQILTIKGTTDGVQESVVALYTPSDTTKKEQVLGKLNVVTYNQIDKHVVIVPVNGNTFDKFGSVAILQDSLNKIYNQGIVNWTVELKPGITVEGIAPFEDGGTGLLSNFTSHMKKVINAYKENTTPDTYYLFLVSNPQDPSTLGVMPRSKEYGFIFADKHSTLPEVARTIAHELGHGAFNLHHTFMEPNYTITKGTTDNLMDYPAGPKLYKYQWDKIRYPDIVMGVFESDEEANLNSTELDFVKYLFKIRNKNNDNSSFDLSIINDPIAGLDRDRVFIAGQIFPKLVVAYSYQNGVTVDCKNIEIKSVSTSSENHASQNFISVDNRIQIYLPDDLPNIKYSQILLNFLTNEESVSLTIGGEFPDYDTYKLALGENAKPKDKWDGTDGSWLTADRESKADRWKKGCDYIVKNKIQGRLGPFAQIADFYDYLGEQSRAKGHQIKWHLGAAKLVHALAVSPIYMGGMDGGSTIISNDIEVILNELNLGICDFAITQYYELLYGQYKTTPLKGNEAYLFDKRFIEMEQGVIAPPIYAATSPSTLDTFQEIVDKDPKGSHGTGAWLLSDVTPAFDAFDVEAKVTDSQFRIDLPLLMLYLDIHKPTWYGFNGHLNSDGTLNDEYKSIIRDYEIK